jgi:hypothetical protein
LSAGQYQRITGKSTVHSELAPFWFLNSIMIIGVKTAQLGPNAARQRACDVALEQAGGQSARMTCSVQRSFEKDPSFPIFNAPMS